MQNEILTTLGGLGLFLMGMVVMTEGLKALAGDALHGWLRRFTRSPASGALTGTIATAVLQSSSATTVTTVGFVAAGLLTFPQALGIIFGANIGTTVTGWMVAFFGFKLKIGAAALPVIFVGAMLSMFGRGGWQSAGRAMAGFGVIFLGIDFMQQGMEGVASTVTPEQFPRDTPGGRLLLVALGILITLVTQSSSAGVAMSMTGLSAGAIDFPQAALLVIGMDVGTTVTAVVASLGSSQAARRTGFSHVIFNLFAAMGALLLLGPYMSAMEAISPGALKTSPAVALVGFHTSFNCVALLVCLPLAGYFTRMMVILVPERDLSLAGRLDRSLLKEPAAAAAALEATLQDLFDFLLVWLGRRLAGQDVPTYIPLGVVRSDLGDTRDFLDALNAAGEKGSYHPQIGSAIHALDHLQRLFWRMEDTERIKILRSDPGLSPTAIELRTIASEIRSTLEHGIDLDTYQRITEFAGRLWREAERQRDEAIEAAVALDLSVAETGRRMGAQRWLQRVAHHIWRVSAHLGGYDVVEAGVPGVSETGR